MQAKGVELLGVWIHNPIRKLVLRTVVIQIIVKGWHALSDYCQNNLIKQATETSVTTDNTRSALVLVA